MRAALLLAALWAGTASAHEFWIDAEAWQVPAGETLRADIRVGETLEGAAYSFVPPNFRRFEIVQDGETVAVTGRPGDRPALNMAAPGDGLATVVHVTKDYNLTYSEWDKFTAFCAHKDFVGVLERHAARGLPQTGFRETYSRHAKALIAVGDGAGQDVNAGLEVEIIALANPYTDDLSGGMPVQVFYQGAPQADVQVELFERAADGSVAVTTTRTDAEGRALLAVRPGHMYLADHVVMRELQPAAEGDPVWESLWASLTFSVPE
jgi:uncharacterized GH25 family protein